MRRSFGTRLKELFRIQTIDERFFEDLEDMLIEGDLGAKTAGEITDEVRSLTKKQQALTYQDVQLLMKNVLAQKINSYSISLVPNMTNIFLFLGVNGVGKTTTIAKMASCYQKKGESVVLAAADTFRAAAIDQLELHAQRIGCRVIKQSHGSDPGAVLYDALQSAKARGEHLVLADTAGRMHTKEHLLRELQKMDKVIKARIDDPACYQRFLVIDATTGQNGLAQAQLFHQAIPIDAMILAKYDSEAKGGILVQISEKLGIPVACIGTGERYDDLVPFDTNTFLDFLVGLAS